METRLTSAAYRLDQRRPQPTTAQRVAKLEQYLAEMAAFSWTQTYKQAERDLAALKAGEAN